MFKSIKNKSIKIQISFSRFFLVYLFSVLAILANFPTFFSRLVSNGFFILFSDLFFVVFTSIIILSIFSFNRILFKAWLIFNIFLLSISAYYLIFWALPFDDQVIIATFFSNSREALEVLTFSLVSFMIVFFVLPALIIIFIKIEKIHSIKKYLKELFINLIVSALGIVFIAYVVLNINVYPKALKDLASTYNPTGYLGAIGLSVVKISSIRNFEQLEPLPELFKFESKKELADELNVVLIIGESSRSDHWQLNGYNRATNPLLSRLNTNNFVSFSNVLSCYTSTWESVLCLTGYKTRAEYFSTPRLEQNILSVFKYFDFKTLWISTSAMGRGAGVFAALGADVQIFDQNLRHKIKNSENIYDEIMFDDYKKFLEDKSPRKFMVVHTLGSHFLYPQRYPKEYSVFKPDCYNKPTRELDSCSKSEKINAYDNSILYTDYIIKTIIDETIKTNKPTFILYVADHGQALGDNINGQENWGHGGTWNNKEYRMKIHVPMIIYANEAFLNHYGKNVISNMQNIKNAPISHDYVFSTILDCIGIEGQVVRKNLSLCSTNFKSGSGQ